MEFGVGITADAPAGVDRVCACFNKAENVIAFGSVPESWPSQNTARIWPFSDRAGESRNQSWPNATPFLANTRHSCRQVLTAKITLLWQLLRPPLNRGLYDRCNKKNIWRCFVPRSPHPLLHLHSHPYTPPTPTPSPTHP